MRCIGIGAERSRKWRKKRDRSDLKKRRENEPWISGLDDLLIDEEEF